MGWYFRDTGPHNKGQFSFWEVHHFWHGFIIMGLSFLILMATHWPLWIVLTLFIIGVWNTLDDLAQHIIQKDEIKQSGYYRTVSFWHWFPYWLLNKIRRNDARVTR